MLRVERGSETLAPLPEEYLAYPDRYFLEWVPRQLTEDRAWTERFGRAKAVAQIRLTGERGGTWHFVLGSGKVSVHGGEHARPSFTVAMPVETWRRLRRGEQTGVGAFLKRELRVEGSKLAAWRIAKLFK